MVVIQFVIDSVTICKVDAGFAPGKREEIRGTTILYCPTMYVQINYCAVRMHGNSPRRTVL